VNFTAGVSNKYSSSKLYKRIGIPTKERIIIIMPNICKVAIIVTPNGLSVRLIKHLDDTNHLIPNKLVFYKKC
jgi:hypothetical protein